MATRREQRRTETITEIKRIALDALAEQGPGGLSIRGIARTIGISPAGLYRYYDGIDALITDLITDAYNDLADAVVAATDPPDPARDRLVAGMVAYREWSVTHPNRFMLIFGTPIPGYEAPQGGPTEATVQRIGQAFFSVAADAWRGRSAPRRSSSRPVLESERDYAAGIAAGFPPDAVSTGLSAWAHFHGLVTLELVGQLGWMYPDPALFYRSEVEQIADRLVPS